MENYNDIRKGQLKLLLLLLSGICLIMIVITTIFEINYYNKYGFFEKTTAEVISQEEIDGVLHDVLEYDAYGVTYVATAERASVNKIGDRFSIYFDKNNPIGIIYNLDYRRVALPSITLVILFIDVVLILYFDRKYSNAYNTNKRIIDYKIVKSTLVPTSKIYRQGKLNIPEE